MDKKDMNIFEPMGGAGRIEFTNMDDVIEYGIERGILVDDSMTLSDKIKLLGVILTTLLFDLKVGHIDNSIMTTGVDIILKHVNSIPNNSIEIINAKNEVRAINNIMYAIMSLQ